MGRVSADGGVRRRKTATVRFTGVLRLEDGIWRVVHSHLSVGATNEETLGYEMTTTIEALADAVQQERPDLAAATAADGTVTIAFSDLEGSTELAVRLGDEKWLDLLRWHDRVVESAVTQENGRVVKSLGDGHMLAFASHLERCEPQSRFNGHFASRTTASPSGSGSGSTRGGTRTRRRSLRSDGHHGGTRCRGARGCGDPRVLTALRTLRNGRAPSHSETPGRPNSRASPVSTSSFRSSGTRSPELASISLAERMILTPVR